MTIETDFSYYVGKRVQISPSTDAWMRGDRYGEIVKVGNGCVHVKMDKSGRTLRLTAEFIYEWDV
jgi:hypothetical protein